MQTSTSKADAEARSPELKMPAQERVQQSVWACLVGVSGQKATQKGTSADSGIKFPSPLMKRFPSDLSTFAHGTELLWG